MKVRLLLGVLALGAVTLTSCGELPPYDLDTETELVIGMETAYAPFNWQQDNANGSFTHKISGSVGYADGYDVQISKLVAANIGKTLVIKSIDWDGLIPALLSGNIDGILAGMSPTTERKQTISFSNEYYRSEVVMVVRTGSSLASATSLADFSGSKIVAQAGTLYVDLVNQIPDANKLEPLRTYTDLRTAVLSTVADAFICELPVAQASISKVSGLEMVRFTGTNGFTIEDEEITVSIGLRKQDTALQSALNTALGTITTAQRNQLMEESLDRQPSTGTDD